MPFYIEYPSWITPEIIPGFFLRWYGMMYIVAFAVTFVLFKRLVKEERFPMDNDSMMNLFFWTILGLLIGARIFAGLFYDPTGRFLRQPWLMFWPIDSSGNFVGLQGMSYHGGVVGAVIAIVIYCRVKGWSILKVGDMATTAIPLGYTFGRIGNFLNGELYGRVTTSWYGVLFPGARRFPASEEWVQETAAQVGIPIMDEAGMVNLPRHASQLYEAFLEGILLFLVMWFIFRKRKPFEGFMIGLYLAGYGLVRFIAEYTRAPDHGIGYVLDFSGTNPAPYLFETFRAISMGQVFSGLMVIAGVLLWLILLQYHRQKPAVETYSEPAAPKKNASRKLRQKLKK
ncbi:prolipoprotein diacylglyceryl transferase [Spirochaeta africana]|uniref:Phosphatidylglycerol--prolipoprotein diacylglyceryl transferase n=1 Tax=Spirochaeta africana (strain ATCC 700263 / DSM 8902 / Z-7692) TaxID=889378 RepID=H9UMR2_SPIAZ|nr:prolipoprotein diacylglyceryl transferase [Spirochaeta africana]AFG38805.1 prolipoprotein diacylglyceryl transferase [Spirochaeta africana DSM 8902]